ncbi:MAG: hypothetical protein OXG13_08040 [Gemmatimonadaceae bacterium]|nr:hypothetical protein [Gemmatimonadaceae bacterium]
MKRALAVALMAALAPLSAADPVERPSQNIALGASYTLEPGPNYGLCTEPGDYEQLTDGVYTDGYFWAQLSTVGWQEKTPSVFTLDLGEVRPIRGVSFNTAAGFADVRWPLTIRVLVAGEDEQFHEIGDLVEMSAQQHGPLVPKGAVEDLPVSFNEAEIHHHYDANRDRYPEKMTPQVREQILRDLHEALASQYGTYRYWTDRLRAHGRYVSLVVWNEPYTFVDEIEVYAGEPEWVNEPLPGPAISDVKEYAGRLAIQKGIRTRLMRDIESLRAAAEEEGVPPQTRSDVLAELAAVEGELGPATEFGDDFQAVLPLNPWHARALRTQAWLWRARGLEPLVFWRPNLWDPVPLIGMPDTSAELAVEVHLMRKEHRAAAFNVSNSSDEPTEVAFRLSGLPGGGNPGYVTVHEVVWTDTRRGDPVAAALPEVAADEDGLYTVSVPSGMTRQVWFTFHPVDVEPGTHEGEIVVESVPGGQRFPLRMHLYPLDFPEQQSLHMGGWDYTDRIGHFPFITSQNRAAIIEHLRERRVDSPWALKLALPRGTHDARGEMTAPPSTDYFDAWIDLWPDAPQYLVFAKVGRHFESLPMGTPEFNTAVKAWVTFWAEHMKASGLRPEQFGLLLVDEPDEPWQDERILAWARPIREADTGVRIWEDTTHREMERANQEMIDACHVLSPNYVSFLTRGQEYRDYYLKKRDQGIGLEFYAAWTSRIWDPYACRLTAWTSWRFGASGFYMWSLTDTGGASSWNEYLTIKDAYSPIFIDEDSVTAGKHLEAMREGVQDYEYFAMLDRAVRQASARGRAGPGIEEARLLLESLPASVCDAAGHGGAEIASDQPLGGFHWFNETVDRTLADKARVQVLAALTELAGE